MMKIKKLLVPALSLSLLVPAFGTAKAEEMKPTVNTPAAQLRADLDYLLSEHFVLAVSAMTKSYDGAKDAEAANKALDQNAADMTPAIASVYGEEGAAEFERIFRGHNDYTADLVNAAKDKDENARAEAEKEVAEFVEEFSAFLGTATEGKLPKKAAEEAVKVHEAQVLEVFDNYVEGDYKEANETFREGYKHMYVISDALAGAITTQMPEKFENTKSDTPAADLRSTLNSLAAEHFALAATGMQKGFDQKEDYDFVSWSEDANTADFKAAIGSIYGEEGAAQFEKVWQGNHINAQAEIVAATLEGDEAKVKEAKAKLDQFAMDFGAFLGAATAENLPPKDAEGAVKAHEALVTQTFDQYVAGDYDASYQSFREGYKFMFGVGQTLGNAIVTQMPDKFAASEMPEDMPKTGMGGASEASSASAMTFAGLGSLLALTALFWFRRKSANQQ
ncbi:copper amine oxidase [Peribacillus frigoritolerans]|nr:copper amine oxidase [Peribacillus frigoritolerans]